MKAREFKLIGASVSVNGQNAIRMSMELDGPVGINFESGCDDTIHVIEKTAYDSLMVEAVKLKQELEFAMKYYKSCGEESDPEFQLHKSAKEKVRAFNKYLGEQDENTKGT